MRPRRDPRGRAAATATSRELLLTQQQRRARPDWTLDPEHIHPHALLASACGLVDNNAGQFQLLLMMLTVVDGCKNILGPWFLNLRVHNCRSAFKSFQKVDFLDGRVIFWWCD